MQLERPAGSAMERPNPDIDPALCSDALESGTKEARNQIRLRREGYQTTEESKKVADCRVTLSLVSGEKSRGGIIMRRQRLHVCSMHNGGSINVDLVDKLNKKG